jgi:hypothetical protein
VAGDVSGPWPVADRGIRCSSHRRFIDDNEVSFFVYARNRDDVPISSGERPSPIQSCGGFFLLRALVAGGLALFIGSAVYWQLWFWGDDGTSIPPVIVAAPMLVVAPEYVMSGRASLPGLIIGTVVGVAGYFAVSAVVRASTGYYGAIAPVVIAVSSGWLVFALVTAGISRLSTRRG